MWRFVVQGAGRSKLQACHGECAVCHPRACSDDSKVPALGGT